jgi:hypothetical protein
MTSWVRQIHAFAAWALVIAIAIQVFLAGVAMPQLGGTSSFQLHIEFGYTAIGLVVLAVVIGAVAARLGRRTVLTALGLLALYVVQTSLPYARGSVPWIAALHPVNALLLFVAAAWYARVAWRER